MSYMGDHTVLPATGQRWQLYFTLAGTRLIGPGTMQCWVDLHKLSYIPRWHTVTGHDWWPTSGSWNWWHYKYRIPTWNCSPGWSWRTMGCSSNSTVDSNLIFVWRLSLLRLATSVPLFDTARWTRELSNREWSNKLVTENKHCRFDVKSQIFSNKTTTLTTYTEGNARFSYTIRLQ